MSAKELCNEIKEAENQTFLLGIKLNLPEDTRKEIVSKKLEKEERFLKTIEEYLKLKDYKPDWKEIAGALKEVKLPTLAEKLEDIHCSVPIIDNRATQYTTLGKDKTLDTLHSLLHTLYILPEMQCAYR